MLSHFSKITSKRKYLDRHSPYTNGFIHIFLLITVLVTGIIGIVYLMLKTSNTEFEYQKRKSNQEELPADTLNWKVYKNDKHGFEIKLPPNWHIDEEGSTSNFLLFIVPDNYKRGGFDDGMIEISVKLSPMYTSSDVDSEKVFNYFSELCSPSTPTSCTEKVKDVYHLEKTIVVNGKTAFQTYGGCCMNTGRHVFVFSKDKTFQITLTNNQGGELENEDVFNKIMSTFSILNNDSGIVTTKLYYWDQTLDEFIQHEECTTNTVKTISVDEKNRIKETLDRLITEGPIEKHANFRLLDMKLNDGILTLKFPYIPSFTTGGSCRIGLLLDQIVKTAKQFSEVDEVRFDPEVFEP